MSEANGSSREQRVVKNELEFRDYNERREEMERGAGDELLPFVCECGDSECIEGMEMTLDDYMGAHSGPARFAVKPGHFFPEAERVVAEHDRFWLVEKRTA